MKGAIPAYSVAVGGKRGWLERPGNPNERIPRGRSTLVRVLPVGLASVRQARARRRYPGLNPVKLRVIDHCFDELACRSFADLGGIWAVDGGYACYAADIHDAERGVVVDDDFTDKFRHRARSLPRLASVRGNFGDREIPARIGRVDVIFAFDILLHQVNPNWDELLGTYAPLCRAVAIVQPHWNRPQTVRLLDLGEAEYMSLVPATDQPPYVGLFSRLDELNPRRNRRWRDVHDIWQWGITDEDLLAAMKTLGFECAYRENSGPWQGSSQFHERAFVFVR